MCKDKNIDRIIEEYQKNIEFRLLLLLLLLSSINSNWRQKYKNCNTFMKRNHNSNVFISYTIKS